MQRYGRENPPILIVQGRSYVMYYKPYGVSSGLVKDLEPLI